MIFFSGHKNEAEAMDMEEKRCAQERKNGCLAQWLSRLFLVLAVTATVLTIKTCCPQLTDAARAALGLSEGGRAQAAFSVLREKLSEGESAVAAFAQSYKSLAGGEN